MSNQKIAVIGERDSVMLFQAVGVHVVYADKPAQVEKAVHRLAREGYAVIYMTEPAVEMAREAVERYRSEAFPAIIPIPDRNGTTGLGMAGIRKDVERAVGADILFSGE